jgi:flagellar hook-associated protein 2
MKRYRGDFMVSTSSINRFRLTGLSGFDTESIVEQLMEVEKVKVSKVYKERQILLWRQELYNSINKDFANFILNTRKDFGLTRVTSTGSLLPNSYKNLSWYKKAVSSNTAIATVSASSGAFDGIYKVNVHNLAEGVSLASSEAISIVDASGRIDENKIDVSEGLTFTIYDGQVDENGELIGFEITIPYDDEKGITMQNVVQAINSAKKTVTTEDGKINEYSIKIKASYDSANQRFFIQTKETGSNALLKIESNNEAFINGLNLVGKDGEVTVEALQNGLRGIDAKIDFNGAQNMTYSTNTITINGITMNLTGTGEFTVTVNTDVDGIYEKIKNFVDMYNELVDKTSKLLTEKRYYDYEPLTEEQKKEMKEKDIELWEEKAKSGLLRNDELISRTMQNIRASLYEPFNGTYSLDPEGVLELLFKDGEDKAEKGIVVRIYDHMIEGMEAIIEKAGPGNEASLYRQVKSNILIDFVTSLGSKSYLDRNIEDYNKRIDELNLKLAEREEYYYQKFSVLETYINRMNAQSMWLAQQFNNYY